MRASFVAIALAVSACASSVPSVIEARALLDEVIEAGLARDWDRLCANASGTCEGELDGKEHLAPSEPPRVAGVSVVEPVREGDRSSSGGVLFVLCGTDAMATPYESEVLVFDGGDRLFAAAAVYWIGTRIAHAPSGQTGMAEQPISGGSRCG